MEKTPVSGFGGARDRVAELMLEYHREELARAGTSAVETAEIEHFTIHDLRRTAATEMAELQIAPHITEKVLNHTSGKISGVAAIYNRFEYVDERRRALDAWSRHVEAMIGSPAPSNVVHLAAGAR